LDTEVYDLRTADYTTTTTTTITWCDPIIDGTGIVLLVYWCDVAAAIVVDVAVVTLMHTVFSFMFMFMCHRENTSSSSRMRVIYHNWSAMKQRPHPQSVAEISHHLSENTDPL